PDAWVDEVAGGFRAWVAQQRRRFGVPDAEPLSENVPIAAVSGEAVGDPATVRAMISTRWESRLGLTSREVEQDLTVPWLSYPRGIRLLKKIRAGKVRPEDFQELREFSLRLDRLPEDILDLVKDTKVSPEVLYRRAVDRDADPRALMLFPKMVAALEAESTDPEHYETDHDAIA